MFCKYCHEEVRDDARKCKHCHSTLVKDVSGRIGDFITYGFMLGLATFFILTLLDLCERRNKINEVKQEQPWLTNGNVAISDVSYSVLEREYGRRSNGNAPETSVEKFVMINYVIEYSGVNTLTAVDMDIIVKDRNGAILLTNNVYKSVELSQKLKSRRYSHSIKDAVFLSADATVEIKLLRHREGG